MVRGTGLNGWTEATTRKAVKERSGEVCELCSMPAVQMHHRRNRSQLGKWHPANIIHVCVACHHIIGANPSWSSEHGYTVLSHEDPASKAVLLTCGWVCLTDDGTYRTYDDFIPPERVVG